MVGRDRVDVVGSGDWVEELCVRAGGVLSFRRAGGGDHAGICDGHFGRVGRPGGDVLRFAGGDWAEEIAERVDIRR